MTFALFRVAAGPRLGHGHLRRAEVLARALGRPCAMSIRGTHPPASVVPGVVSAGPGATLDVVRPRVLILDDPQARASLPWCEAARRRAVPVVSIHDLGLAPIPSDLAIDGSIVRRGSLAARHVFRSPAYAVIAHPVPRHRAGEPRRLLVSLGGGARAGLARRIATAVRRRWPRLEILVTGGTGTADGISWVTASAGLAPWLARVDMAVVGGGLSLYEAVAAGVPAVAVAVVAAQRPTIRGFAARGLALAAGGRASGRPDVASVTRAVGRIIGDAALRRRVAVEGPRTVDGRGAARVARAIVGLAEGATRA